MKSIIGSVVVICLLVKVSLSQHLQEVVQPGLSPEDCYCIDTYKTDFGPSDELVRSERSFFKKLFKNWGKRFGDCVPCCQNNAEYSASTGNDDYNSNGNYDSDNNYQEKEQYNEPAYGAPYNGPGHHGHIYLPLPHPHRIMSHLHGYLNRPFRRGGKGYSDGGYPPQEAYGEQKPAVEPAVAPAVEEANAPAYEAPAYEAPAYEAPAPVEEVKPTYPEKTEYSSAEKVKPTYSEKQDYSGSAESSEDKKDGYKEVKKSENSYGGQPQVTPQIVQSIVPIMIPPVYIYTPQYYSPPAPAYSPPTSYYSAPAPSTPTYSAPAPLYTPSNSAYAPPASSYSPPPPAPSYSPPTESYTPPSSSYSAPPRYSEPAMPYLESYSSLLNPSNYSPSPNYYKRTYSTSLTYLLPPTPPCYNTPSYSYYDCDQPIRSCPELFTSYGDDLGSSHPY